MSTFSRRHYRRLVEAVLLVGDASSEAMRAERSISNAANPIERMLGSLEEVERLCSEVGDSVLRSELLRMAMAIRGDAERACSDIERSLIALKNSTKCTQEAASKLKVA